MKVIKALEMYATQLEADGRSPHTIAQARRHVGLLARFVGDRDITEVGHEDVARFLASAMAMRTPDGRAKRPTSVNALRSSVRCFCAFTCAAGYTSVDPARLVRRARCGPTTPRGLTPAESERLLATLAGGASPAARRDRVLFGLMLASGVRLGSALGLDIEDVDLDDRSLRLRTMKGGGELRVFVPEGIARELRAYIAERRFGPLFLGAGGERLGARQTHRRLAMASGRAGIRPISPHALRHAFALDLYQRTGDVLLVQAALGHRNLMSTAIYARATAERVRAAVGA